MAQEIERKFLVSNMSWKAGLTPEAIRQGYLAKQNGVTARVRTKGEKGFLTIKGPTSGFSRAEFEYEVPFADALGLLKLASEPQIVKNRYHVTVGDHIWEVDEFFNENAGLVVAEIELASEDEVFELPDWIGAEVSLDHRYMNSSLAAHPFCLWEKP